MYAIVEVGGRQHMMEPNRVVKVDKLEGEHGDQIRLDKVLAIHDDEGEMRVGTPYLQDASVTARVVQQGRDPKVLIVKYKAKKHYRRRFGHRQPFTALQIMEITG